MRRFSCILALLLSTTTLASPIENLNPVGSATLKVLFWTIYDSYLYTDDGVYQGVEPGLALKINYRRNISKADLIDRTRQEWQALSLYRSESEAWLSRLDALWPDLKRGDELVLKVDDKLASDFYFNGNFIGKVDDSEFTRNFLAIWLSENSSYPRLRNQLVGES